MSEKTINLETEYSACRLCPRNCGVDRTVAEGYCREKSSLHVARASLHMWEEPCISGKSGSGTIFFSGCNMGCVFCQNSRISRGEVGKYIDIGRLIEIFYELKEKGANNINLVTGDMFIPTIRTAIRRARDMGFDLPFLLNTSSYLNVDTVKSLQGLIDIYLPDFKYIREEDAVRYSNAPGYVRAAKEAIDEMVRQQQAALFADEGQKELDRDIPIMRRGVVIRHLLMPGMLIQAKMIVKYLYERYGDSVYLSLLSQYTPGGDLSSFPEINRKVTGYEYKSLVEYAAGLGITRAFVQEGDTARESFIPDFDLRGV
jgi:putative pyruvate formate lyase activating enzyme